MKLYLAGNFPQLSDPKKEIAMLERLHKAEQEYNRLISFFYKKEAMTVINIVKDRRETKKGTTLVRRKK